MMDNNEILYETKTKGLLKGGAALKVYSDRVEIDDADSSSAIGSLLSFVGKKRSAAFNFADCLALEKDGSDIRFILLDGTAKNYSVGKDDIDAAYSFAAQAFKPYRDKMAAERQAAGVVCVAVSGDGLVATAYGDRLELREKTGTASYSYDKIRLVRVSTVRKKFEIYLTDGTQRADSIMESQRQGLLTAVKEKIAPFNALRQREAGIKLAVESEKDGLLYAYDDRVEFVDFMEKRTAAFPLAFLQHVELSDGKIKFNLKYEKIVAFAPLPLADDSRTFLLKFFNEQINRSDRRSFGLDDLIQVDEAKKTLTIFARGGVEISNEIKLDDVIEFVSVEELFKSGLSEQPLTTGATTSLRESVDNLKALGREKTLTLVGVNLTLAADGGEKKQTVKFGNFPKGIQESNKDYYRAALETERFISYLAVSKLKGLQNQLAAKERKF